MKKIFEFYKKTMVCKNMVKYDILCYFDEIKIFEIDAAFMNLTKKRPFEHRPLFPPLGKITPT